jgi:hypothetical protein
MTRMILIERLLDGSLKRNLRNLRNLWMEIIQGTRGQYSSHLPQPAAPPEPGTDLLSPTHDGSEIAWRTVSTTSR